MTRTVHLREVGVTFDDGADQVRAVVGVTMAADAGEFVAVKGPSGSGKSTLLNVIAGLQGVAHGDVSVAGVDVTTADEDARALMRLERVGVVFQDNNLIREFTAHENVELPLRARGRGPQEAARDAQTMLERVGLEGLGRRRPPELSGGQRQRVGIARALVGGRAVLVADEPTGALDTQNSRAVFDLLRGLAHDGVCVIVASHDAAIDGYADRVLHMRDGQLS